MQITNNYQPNFRAARIDADAMKVLAKRLKPQELDAFVKKFKDIHDTDEYDIVLGALSENKPRLDACIKYNEDHFRHMSEGIFSSLFCNPKNFMKSINRMMTQDVVSIGTKGHVKISFLDKLCWFLL